MDGPIGRPHDLADHYHENRPIDLYCAESVPSSTRSEECSSDETATNPIPRQNGAYNNQPSPLTLLHPCPGTSPSINEPLSVSLRFNLPKVISMADEHLQSKNQNGPVGNNNQSINGTILSGTNLYSNGNRRELAGMDNQDPPRHSTNNNNEPGGKPADTPDGWPITLAIRSHIVNESYSGGSRRNASPARSPPPNKKKENSHSRTIRHIRR